MVRKWDLGTASPIEIQALLATLNAVLATDLPSDPLFREDSFREYMALTMPGEQRVSWVAESGPGALARGEPALGHASVLLMGDMGVIDIAVHPEHRRSGIGRNLLAVVARRLAALGLRSVGVEAIGGTPTACFYEANGFHLAFTEMRGVLTMDTVDWRLLGNMARNVSSGYRLEFYPGGPPEWLYEPYAQAKELVREDAPGDLELRPSSYDPERLRASLNTLRARGMRPFIVVSIHERSGEVAGLTEVVVPAHRPSRADQYDTIVIPAHRGYGLVRAMKARMLFELRAAEPQLIDVQTWNAIDNDWLRKVNAELGFVPDREWREYEAEVSDLSHLLHEAA